MIIIDEVQKIPILLDEVHYLIESNNLVFALCGSSARKVKREHANMLGGRAIRYELFGLSARELKKDFNLERMLNNGYIPDHYLRKESTRLIRSYINDYLKEEILDEGLTRNLPVFSKFLDAIALSDGQVLSYTNVASDCGVSSTTVKSYVEILIDTLLGSYLSSYTKRPKRKTRKAPKFYLTDVGVVNILAKRGVLIPGSFAFGQAMENWVYHELRLHREYTEQFYDLSYWQLTNQTEVDFIIGDMKCAVEVKGSSNITNKHLKGLRELKKDFPEIKERIVVSLIDTARRTEDGILILPAAEFIDRLWEGEIEI